VQPMMRRAPMVSSNHMNPQAQPRFMAHQRRPFGPAPAVRFGANQNAQPQFRRPMQQQIRAPQRQIRAQTPMRSQHIMATQQQIRTAVQPMMRRAPMVSADRMNPQQRRPVGAHPNTQPQLRRPMQTQQIRAQTPMHSQQTRTIAQSAENNLQRNVVSAPTSMATPLLRTVPAPIAMTTPQMMRTSPMMSSNRMDPQAHARARSQHIMSPVVRIGVDQQTQQIQSILRTVVGSDKPQAMIGAQKRRAPPLTVMSQLEHPSADIMSVSPASSRPSSATQFAYAPNSNMAPSDGTVISTRSSISSVSPDSRVRRSTTSQFMPSELTAKRDVYDFKLKRDINCGIVLMRQLNAAKKVSKAQTNKAPTKTMSNAQKRRARRSRKTAMAALSTSTQILYGYRSMAGAPKMSKAQKRKLRRKQKN